MRTLLLTLAIVLGLAAIPAHHAALLAQPATAVTASPASIDAQQAQPQQSTPQVNVQVHRDGGWRPSPVWIAIGAIGAVLLILIIVLIARGGGGTTTVVR